MIDIENYIITAIETAVQNTYPDAVILGDAPEAFAQFPAVTVNEIGNATLRRMQDNETTEHYTTVTYEINVYCNDRIKKKSQCKNIIGIIDEVMINLNFTRLLTRRLPNIDRSIYRIYTRYTAVVDSGMQNGLDGVIYHVYRR